MNLLQKASLKINRAMEISLVVSGLAMTLVAAVQVFFRYALNHSLFWTEELARYILTWISFSGATTAYFHNLHPGVDAVYRRLGERGRTGSRFMVLMVCLFLSLVMIVSGIRFAWLVRLQVSPALFIPKWIIMGIIPFSGMVLAIHILSDISLEISRRKDGHDA